MHPNDSLDSDEDEIIVLETVIVDTPNNSAEVVNPRVIKDQKSNFECEEGNERFKIVRRGGAADMFYREPKVVEKVKPIEQERSP